MERIPADFQKALTKNAKAKALWKELTDVSRRDFISWITSAKQAETRKRRISVALDKLLSGKKRPCCYAVVPMNLYKALDISPKAKAQWKTLTPMNRRDFTDWIQEAENSEIQRARVEKACIKLAAGKLRP